MWVGIHIISRCTQDVKWKGASTTITNSIVIFEHIPGIVLSIHFTHEIPRGLFIQRPRKVNIRGEIIFRLLYERLVKEFIRQAPLELCARQRRVKQALSHHRAVHVALIKGPTGRTPHSRGTRKAQPESIDTAILRRPALRCGCARGSHAASCTTSGVLCALALRGYHTGKLLRCIELGHLDALPLDGVVARAAHQYRAGQV
mmetsp:Transcript_24291/g.49204  ORF Transcript_24291/g.49204 Transcript_24291/m.49204 type:complete len:202 (-) Transcript_24291:722-1327(-)